MTVIFYILAAITIAGTAASMSLRNLVHCVLSLTLGLVGLAALYLELGAQFVGFTQILVYVGAVAILAMFAIMMTRGTLQETQQVEPDTRRASRISGVLVAACVFAVLAWAITSGSRFMQSATLQPQVSVNQIGIALMRRYVLPLELIGVLLTAALIGAGILAMDEARRAR